MSAPKNEQKKQVATQAHAPLTFMETIVAGGFAGMIECCVMYPLDVVKTLQQLKVGKNEGTFKVLLDMLKREKFGIYRGIAAPLLMETPKRAIKFSAFATFKPMFQKSDGKVDTIGAALSGSCAGMTEATIVVPFELVKIRMQDRTNVGRYKSSMDAVVKIAKEEGVLAFYKGFESTLWRNAVWNASYFGILHSFKETYPASEEWSSGWRGKLRNFTIGMMGGTIATTLNTPFDVVKSRFQNSSTSAPWTWSAVLDVYKKEGARALWKGYIPKVLRLGPGGGILFLVYETVADYFRKRRGVA